MAADGRPTILVAEKLGAGGVDMLKEVGNVDLSYNLTKDELVAKISLVDALIVRSATKVRRQRRVGGCGAAAAAGQGFWRGVGDSQMYAAGAHGANCVVAACAMGVFGGIQAQASAI